MSIGELPCTWGTAGKPVLSLGRCSAVQADKTSPSRGGQAVIGVVVPRALGWQDIGDVETLFPVCFS